MTTAYSYIRFSTKAQKVGRSHERQLEAYEKWVAKKGFTPADERFFDEGRSGYSGEHLGERGQLKRFLDLVEAKKIARGSYLVVESLDRLSRQNVDDALTIFLRIRSAGIHICTLMDSERVYSPGGDVSELIMSMLVMARANEESETKSKRGKEDWQSKFAKARTEKKPYGKRVPRWLKTVELDELDEKGKKKKKYEPDPDRVPIVERVFKATIAGHGFVAIARDLNADGIKAFRGGTWCATSIDDLLKNRSVLGEWQPGDGGSAIEGYFPQIIDNETFKLAEEAMSRRRFVQVGESRKPRVTKQSANFQVWQSVGFCSICASPMYLLSKNRKFVAGKLYTYKYLLCSNKRKGLCMEAATIRLEDSEAAFKEILVNVGALGLIQSDAAATTDAMALVDATIHQKETLLARHTAAAAETGAASVYRLMASTEQEIERLKAERAELDAKHIAQTVAQSDKAWLLKNLPLVERDDRQRANALLLRLGIVVRIAGGELPLFTVYQRERLIMKVTVVDRVPETESYSPDVTMRMYDQGELKEHELYIDVGFGSKKLPKQDAPVPQARPRADSADALNWNSLDEPLYEQDFEDEYTPTGE
jgi:DNA invertase Pin-like site-specific DNA recombinase